MDCRNPEFINITSENIDNEHLCCIIRTRKAHPGVEAKRKWLLDRLSEGHIFRKLNEKATVFIEYAPLENAWVPVQGDNYYYIYCLWASGEYKGKGYGKSLMEYCINDAKNNGKSGICMLGAKKQKAWLPDQTFAKSFGFKTVDSTEDGYELLALSFDGTKPMFTQKARKQQIENQELTIFYDMQCPYVLQNIEKIRKNCDENNIPVEFNEIDSLKMAKDLPCVFNNFAVFYKGQLKTVNVIDEMYIHRIISK